MVKTTVGATPVTLPIGRNPYLPIIIDDGGDAEYTVGVSNGVYTDPTNPTTELTSNVVTETWTIQSNSAVNDVIVQIGWDAAEEAGFTRATSGIAYWENDGVTSAWNKPISTSAATGSGPYFQTRTMDFTTNLYYLGVGDNSSPLPVELTYFGVEWLASASLSNQTSTSLSNPSSTSLGNPNAETDTERSRSGSRSAALNWQTAMEENNSHFEIQRSLSGVEGDWEQIGRVEGQGSTFETTDYQFIDNSSQLTDHRSRSAVNGEPSTIYYRLKQIDYDGKFEYSETRTLSLTERSRSQNSFIVWPNPNNGTELFLTEIGNYQVFNTQGILLKSHIQAQKMDISDLAKGTCIIQDELGAHQVLIRH